MSRADEGGERRDEEESAREEERIVLYDVWSERSGEEVLFVQEGNVLLKGLSIEGLEERTQGGLHTEVVCRIDSRL